MALVGATMIDVSHYGNNEQDISNAVVIMQYGQIIAAGEKSKTKIPQNATIVDLKGKYIIPGLIDCFSVISTQSQANSHFTA